MSKKSHYKVLSSAGLAAMFATSAIVPVYAAEEVKVQKLDNVIVNIDGQNVELSAIDYSRALRANVVTGSDVGHVASDSGSIYTVLDYSRALRDANNNPAEAFELLEGKEKQVETVEGSYDSENGKIDFDTEETPEVGDVKVESVSAINDTTVTVTFNQALESVSADNFKVDGLSVTGASLSEDKKTVTLKTTRANAGKTYDLTISDLKIAGEVQPEIKTSYTVDKASSIYGLEMTTEGNVTTLEAQNGKSVLVEVKVLDNKGEFVEDGEVEIELDSTFGSFAEKRVTVQNGVAKVLFQSETLSEERVANLTATIKEATNTNLIGLKQEISLVLEPVVAGGEKENIGAQLTDITVNQAERIMLHFNKEVDAAAFNKAYLASPQKVGINVSQDDSRTHGVAGFKAVDGNNKAIYAILEKDGYLTDNEYVTVNFNDSTEEITGTGMAKKVLTDFRDPAMLDVQVSDLRTIKVVFSEPVHDQSTTHATSATNPNNWVLDGNKLSSSTWGTGAKVEVGEFDPKTGEDNRHIATITLGQKNGEQVYFKPGQHTIQGANIGDWANLTDSAQNTLNTQTLKFNVAADNEAPQAEVLVQSPEQYIVKFDKTLGKTPKASDFRLQKRVVSDDGEVSWVDPTVENNTQKIRVTQLANNEYKVEVEQDWTKVYDTKESNKNYYNDTYRLFIAEGKVTAAGSGNKNVEQSLVLGGAMTAPDTTSPVIEDYKFNGVKQTGVVTMSEPVKFPGENAGDGLPTQAQGQDEIPTPTADYIGKDKDGNTVTIPAKSIEKSFVDNYDMQFVVEPSKELTAGEWQLVVRSISDDVGNTAASATFDFDVKEAEDVESIEAPFAVAWADAHNDNKLHNNSTDNSATGTVEEGHDVVHVKFTQPVATTGEQGNALRTTAYTVNGKSLPSGSTVVADIAGHDNGDEVVDSVTLLLPKGTITDADSTTITVSPELLTADSSEKITNGGLHKLPTNRDYRLAANSLEVAEAELNKALEDAKEVPNKDDKYKLADLIADAEEAKAQAKEAFAKALIAYDSGSVADQNKATLAMNRAKATAETATTKLEDATKLAVAKEELAELINEAKDAGVAEEDIKAAETVLEEATKVTEIDAEKVTLQNAIDAEVVSVTAEITNAVISLDNDVLTLTASEAVAFDKNHTISLETKDNAPTLTGTVAKSATATNEIKITLDSTEGITSVMNLKLEADTKKLVNFAGDVVNLKINNDQSITVEDALSMSQVEANISALFVGDNLAADVTAEQIADVKSQLSAQDPSENDWVRANEDLDKAEALLAEVEAAEAKLTGNANATIDEGVIKSLEKRDGFDKNDITITGAGIKTIAVSLDKVTVNNKAADIVIAEGVTVGELIIEDAAEDTVTINGKVATVTINDTNGVRLVVGETGEVTNSVVLAEDVDLAKVTVKVENDKTVTVTVTVDGEDVDVDVDKNSAGTLQDVVDQNEEDSTPEQK